MKIAIPSEAKSPESKISPNAGRAPYFLIFQEGEFNEVLENPYNQPGERGVGPKIAQLLVEKGINKVIVKEIGPNMKIFLENNSVEVEITDEDEVAKAVKE